MDQPVGARLARDSASLITKPVATNYLLMGSVMPNRA
jgi:hypothetical protein